MLLNNQGQVVKLTKNEEQACREANSVQTLVEKNPQVPIGTQVKRILNKRIEILKPLREKLWPSNEKPDAFFRLGERARLV